MTMILQHATAQELLGQGGGAGDRAGSSFVLAFSLVDAVVTQTPTPIIYQLCVSSRGSCSSHSRSRSETRRTHEIQITRTCKA